MQIDSILDKLNLRDKDGLFYFTDIEKDEISFISNRIKESLLKIKPDYFFCINNEPLILFFENPENLEILQKQIWNFNQSPAVFIKMNNQWVVKNGFKLLEGNKELETLANSNNISDFDYFKIITGETWEKYKSKFENKNRVDYFLLQNIETARNLLKNKGKLDSKIANSLIGRVIFIRYLIDRKVGLNKYTISKKEDFYTILSNKNTAYRFFKQIRDDFNGNLFPLQYEINGAKIKEADFVSNEHLSLIISLLNGDKLDDIVTQISLFDIYDFSIIPIEFISNVYEKFIGAENQANQGAYYTPLFLVDYIQQQTVSKYFSANPQEYNCKVLDPACGSGIFLVETLRQIISQYQLLNPKFKDEQFYEEYKNTLKTLLVDNIFGVDKDENAISVAIFSLYITLLDYLTPRSIVGFKFPPLQGTNFFNIDFFDIELDETFKKHHFQFIFGNPPWATKHKGKQLFENYIEKRKIEEKSSLEIENREIAEAFLVRVSDFNFEQCSFIITSKILYKISRKKEKKGIFRKYFLSKFKVSQVFELSSVRHQVFDKSNDKAVAPATILFYSKSLGIEESRKNLISHISLKPNVFFETFKLMVIEKYDYKELLQSYFIDEDWIWKVLVYGNILDYYFIKRLKTNKSIYDYISSSSHFTFGKGISVGGGDKNPIAEHKKIKYSIDSKNKGLKPFNISYTNNFLSDLEYVHRQRKLELFKSPVLLVGKGISNSFMAKSAIAYHDVIYTDAITGIKPLDEKGFSIINVLLALFNSELFSYFLVLTNSSIGIEREQAHDKDDKFSVPLIESNNDYFKNKINQISKLIIEDDELIFETFRKQDIKNEILALKNEINNEIYNLYDLSDTEKDLVNYNNSVTIPLLKGTDAKKKDVSKRISYKAIVLEEYSKVFINHFGNRFNSDNKYFEVEILFSNHTILMKFKIISEISIEKNNILWIKEGDKELLQNISNLSFENLSHNLFMQKDVKGFEEDFFYVAKPNQFKSWHPALAYLDLAEFIDALHNSKK